MKSVKRAIIISDLHIGGDNQVENLDPLIDFLCDDVKFKDAVLVIAGDMLDAWAHPINKVPPSYKQIIYNKNKFWTALTKRASKTPVYYLNGNHDFNLLISHVEDKSGIIQITPQDLLNHFNNELYIDHGNCVDLFNAPGESDDSTIPYPIGYFKTRLHHTRTDNTGIPMQTDLYLNQAKAEVIRTLYNFKGTKLDQISELNELLDSISRTLLDGFRKDIQSSGISNYLIDIDCLMPKDSDVKSYNFQEVLTNYTGFVSRFYHNNLIPSIGYSNRDPLDVPWEELAKSIDVVRTGGLSWYAKKIGASKSNALTFVFGHTHMNQIEKLELSINNEIVYANSGCWCENSLGPNVTSVTYDFESMKLSTKNEDLTL